MGTVQGESTFSLEMIRTGMREKMVSVAVIFLVMFFVVESYIGDINTVAVEHNLVETNEELDVVRFRGAPKSNLLPQEIDLKKGKGEDEDGGRSYYFTTANEIVPEGSLDEMVEDANIDMEEYIKEAETEINNSINTSKNVKNRKEESDKTKKNGIVKTQ